MNINSSIKTDDMKLHLKNVIEVLPEQDRIILALYYYEKLVVSDIAKVIETNETQVEKSLDNILSKIKTNLIQA
jgi:RNA polymerase sigma factor (sigma-70 family)